MVGIASLLGCTSILNFVNDKLTHARYPICFILSAVFIIVGFHYYTNANWFIVYSAIIVVLILFKAIQRGTVDSYIHFSLVILLGLLVCAGSDSGFTKTYYYFSAIAPLIFISYKEEFANIFACRFMAVVILCISVHALAYEIRLYRCWTNIGKVQVLMKNEDAQRRSQVYRDYKEYGSEGYALFYGWPDAHFMYAATGESLKYRPTFWMGLSNHTLPEHDKREIQEILALLISNDSFKLFDYSHSLQLKELAKEYGLIGQEVSPVTTVYSFKWKRK